MPRRVGGREGRAKKGVGGGCWELVSMVGGMALTSEDEIIHGCVL